uniref:Uncharacterized protein n=1 Tax=Leersia perrieri TaxID=77586 RepID=A0A0D9WT62_9ORYZ
MEHPAIAHRPRVPAAALRQNYIDPPNRRPAADDGARSLIIRSAIFLISTAGAIVVVHTAGNSSTIDDENSSYALIAFLLFILGIWLVVVAFVEDKFPRATRAAVAIAKELHDYLIGGN